METRRRRANPPQRDPSGAPAVPSWAATSPALLRAWRRREGILIGLVLALAAFLRFYRIGAESIWLDEHYSIAMGHRSFSAILDGIGRDNHPPGYYFLIKAWMAVLGDSEEAVRSLSALAGVAGVAAAHFLGRDLFGQRAGLFAALFLSLSQIDLVHSQTARQYALLAALSTLSMHGYWLAFRKPSKATGAYYVAASTALLYIHFNGLFVVAAQAMHRAIQGARGWDPQERRRSLFLFGAIGLLYLPWSLVLLAQARRMVHAEFWVAEPTFGNLLDTVHIFLGSKTYGIALHTYPEVRWTVFAAGVALVANAFLRSRLGGLNQARNPDGTESPQMPGSRMVLLALWVAVSLLAPFAISKVSANIYLHRTVLTALPAVALLVGAGLGRLSWRPLRYLAVVLLVAPLVPAYHQQYTEMQNEQWREAAAFVDGHAAPGALVVLHRSAGPFLYYHVRDDVPILHVPALVGNSTPELRDGVARSDEVWFVLNRHDEAIGSYIWSDLQATHPLEPLDPAGATRSGINQYSKQLNDIALFKAVRATPQA